MQADAEQDTHAPDEATFVKTTVSKVRRIMRDTACSLKFRRRQKGEPANIKADNKAAKEDTEAERAQKAMEEAMEEMKKTLAMWDWERIRREMDWVKLGTPEEALNSHPLPWSKEQPYDNVREVDGTRSL